MARRVVYGLVALALAGLLLGARLASHRLVFDALDTDTGELFNYDPTRPRVFRSEVENHFGVAVEQLASEKPGYPGLPLIRFVGLMTLSPILIASLVLPLPILMWKKRPQPPHCPT